MKNINGTRALDRSSNNNYQQQIKHGILSQYPTTIRRSVCVSDIISVDHSVNKWLYERWIASNREDAELTALHKEMANRISHYINNPKLEITFVHLDPRTNKHRRASY